ncbi:MAG: hypothetical protein HYR51_09170 [Candidatus Rokubacteria bacterium]|nr:hypothetical protein [Candidatus Rokubacteria bacterium]
MHRLAVLALFAAVAVQVGCATATPPRPSAAAPPADEVLDSLRVIGVVAGSVPADATLAPRTPAAEAARRGASKAAAETFVGFTVPCLQPTAYFLFQLVACPVAGLAAASLGAGVAAVVEATRAGTSDTVQAVPGIVATHVRNADPAAALRDRVASLATDWTRRRAWRFVALASADAPPVDSLLEISVEEVGLDGPPTQVNPPLALFVTVRTRLLRVPDMAVLHDGTLTRRSAPRGLHGWLADDARRLREEIDQALRELGERIVDEVFLLSPPPERLAAMERAFVSRRIPFLRDGVTTRDEIVARLGDPDRRYDAGRILGYVLFEDHRGRLRPTPVPGGGTLPAYRLLLTFSLDDRLEDHRLVRGDEP